MQNVIQRFVKIPQGAIVSSGINVLGSFDENNPDDQFKLRKIRVFPIEAYVEKLTALLTTPGGIVVGPIDIPFTFNVELPVAVVVNCPVSCSNNQTIMMIASDLPDSPNLYGATYLAQPQQNAYTNIFDAVVAVTGYPSTATLSFKDGAGNVIATATGFQPIARPRLAKTVASNSATPAILFHY